MYIIIIMYVGDNLYKFLLLIALCSVCHNEGLCVAPETCHCTGGWIGNTCDTGNCAIV